MLPSFQLRQAFILCCSALVRRLLPARFRRELMPSLTSLAGDAVPNVRDLLGGMLMGEVWRVAPLRKTAEVHEALDELREDKEVKRAVELLDRENGREGLSGHSNHAVRGGGVASSRRRSSGSSLVRGF